MKVLCYYIRAFDENDNDYVWDGQKFKPLDTDDYPKWKNREEAYEELYRINESKLPPDYLGIMIVERTDDGDYIELLTTAHNFGDIIP